MAIPEEKMYPRTGGRRSTDGLKQGSSRYRTKGTALPKQEGRLLYIK